MEEDFFGGFELIKVAAAGRKGMKEYWGTTGQRKAGTDSYVHGDGIGSAGRDSVGDIVVSPRFRSLRVGIGTSWNR